MKSPKFALLWERNPERNLYKFPFGAPSSCTIGMKLIQLPVDPLFCETNGTFSIQPSKQLYRDRDEASIYHCRVRTKISHILRSVLVQDSLSSRCLASSWSLMSTGELTEQPDEMLSKGLGGGRGGGGTCHGRAFRPRGELQYFSSLHATETRIRCCWIGIVARVQIYLSMH